MADFQLDELPTYRIWRTAPLDDSFDLTAGLNFYPPKGSAELDQALQFWFPLSQTPQERRRDAVIAFLNEEKADSSSGDSGLSPSAFKHEVQDAASANSSAYGNHLTSQHAPSRMKNVADSAFEKFTKQYDTLSFDDMQDIPPAWLNDDFMDMLKPQPNPMQHQLQGLMNEAFAPPPPPYQEYRLRPPTHLLLDSPQRSRVSDLHLTTIPSIPYGGALSYLPGYSPCNSERGCESVGQRLTPARRSGRAPTTQNGYRCGHEGCARTFDRLCDLRHHARMHIASHDRPFVCVTCGKRFLYNKDLARHMRQRGHVGLQRMACGQGRRRGHWPTMAFGHKPFEGHFQPRDPHPRDPRRRHHRPSEQSQMLLVVVSSPTLWLVESMVFLFCFVFGVIYPGAVEFLLKVFCLCAHRK